MGAYFYQGFLEILDFHVFGVTWNSKLMDFCDLTAQLKSDVTLLADGSRRWVTAVELYLGLRGGGGMVSAFSCSLLD